MTESLGAIETALTDFLGHASDDVERYQEIKKLESRLDLRLKREKADIANRLHDGRSWSQVGKLLGVTGSRAEQISRASR